MIGFRIDHLNRESLTYLDFRPRRAVAVGQQQLNGAQLLVDINVGDSSLAGGDTPELLN
jgi:hypothetical protein